ncbi:ribosome small subunit-dependent GTPase A [Aquipuribacter sp. SD81]|uniref:ribosome small subunit-dependent GTPase A n=1 Tax=Aquipuribacter sp. SD81 TaxID=3127703 RepID=UPI00301648C0
MVRRRSTASWDESDARSRPPRRGTRPRTKDRPAHRDALTGWVTTVDRGRYTCLVPAPEHTDGRTADAPPDALEVTAMRARALRPGDVAVGDRVGLVGDTSGGENSLARLVRVEERTSALRRSADDTDPVERVVVANADQVCLVVAAADPQPNPRLVDRALVAAWDAGVDPLLVVTKTDLADPVDLVTAYSDLGLRVLGVSREGWCGLDAVRGALAGRVTALVGPSGVGKSTLVNELSPGAYRAVSTVSETTGKGRHTSTSAIVLPLATGGWAVDTPGIRSFGLAHVGPDELLRAFPDLADGTDECPRGCSHDEEECGLDAWVAAGHSSPARLESYRRLLGALRAAAETYD